MPEIKKKKTKTGRQKLTPGALSLLGEWNTATGQAGRRHSRSQLGPEDLCNSSWEE